MENVGCKLKKPCHDCPFRRSARYMDEEQVLRNLAWVQRPASVIVCHHTVSGFEADGSGHGASKQLCAGALVFQQRAGLANFFAIVHVLELADCPDIYANLAELAANGAVREEERAKYVRENKVYNSRLTQPASAC